MPSDKGNDLNWYKVLDLEELPEGRVKTVTAGHRQLAMTPTTKHNTALSTTSAPIRAARWAGDGGGVQYSGP